MVYQLQRSPPPLREIMRCIAFLGRYAHQPADVVGRMTMTEMQLLAECTAQLLIEEEEALERRMLNNNS